MAGTETVAIWHIGRSGSNVFGSLIEQHSQISWSNEIFNPYMPARLEKGQAVPSLFTVFNQHTESSIKQYQCFDVKFLSSQHPSIYNSDAKHIYTELLSYGCHRHVLLLRLNTLHRMISHSYAAFKQSYHYKNNQFPPTAELFYMPLNNILVGINHLNLLDWLVCIENTYLDFSYLVLRTAPNVLILTYEEDILPDPFLAYSKLTKWLNLDTEEVKLIFTRTPFQVNRSFISNYDTLSAYLSNTRYQWMLA